MQQPVNKLDQPIVDKSDYTNSVEPDRCLARVVRIIDIKPMENMNNIELAFVLGWQCVVQKNEFKIGDLAIYYSIDTVFDPKFEKTLFLKGKRLLTKNLFGTLSQGLLSPLTWLQDCKADIDLSQVMEDDDVTQIMRVRKFVMTAELALYQAELDSKKRFPQFVPKTDEERIQNIPKVLNKIIGEDITITRKEDGTSATFIHLIVDSELKSKFLVCSRNNVLEDDLTHNTIHYFEVARKYCIENKMREYGKQIAIQGEIVGPNANRNVFKLKTHLFRVFNIWDISTQSFLPWSDVEQITRLLGLDTVPVIYSGPFKPEWTTKSLITMANELEYLPNVPAEGIVVKTNAGREKQRYSFKVLSNKYLLKHKI